MKQVISDYKEFFSNFSLVLSCLLGFAIFIVSLVINYFASQYAFQSQSNHVTDILLDNIPVVNMDSSFVYGTIAVIIFIAVVLLSNPKKVAFTLKAMALFIVVRSLFVIMTHLGPSPLSTLDAPGDIGRAFTSGADLFFSGHTGMPFLFALMFWKYCALRYVFICISIIAAAGVLLGHIHYSIDVASAYFITHGVFLICEKVFKKDREVFLQ